MQNNSIPLPSVEARHKAATLLARTARDFYSLGWMWGTSGNLSVRLSADPLIYMVTVSGRAKGELTPQDVVLLGTGGRVLGDGHGQPSAEAPVHEVVYRKFDAGAVFHVHTVMAGVVSEHFAARGGIRLQGLEMLKGLGHAQPDVEVTIPIIDNHADSEQIALGLEKAAAPGCPGVLIKNHGLYAWGRDAFEARRHVEIFEYLFNWSYHVELLRRAP
jgi:methylthioribulose-1-phosphate dehydratase